MFDSLCPQGLYSPWNSPGQNTGVGSLSFLQGIFPTQGSIPGLPHGRQILYQLSPKGSPRILHFSNNKCVNTDSLIVTKLSEKGKILIRQIVHGCMWAGIYGKFCTFCSDFL